MPVLTLSSKDGTKDNTQYETLRRAYINADLREAFPREIHVVSTASEVQEAILRASAGNLKVGVRSGGHTFSNPSLIHDGILIDTTNLNRNIEYDPITHDFCYGPAVRVAEVSALLEKHKRFFPHGHAPTVALGGFTLAGGQGMFMPTWGPTVGQWILKMEIVTPDGQLRLASPTENTDLFWAARGSGQAFFGVVTRVWARTIPARRMFMRMMMFRVEENIEVLLEWALETSRLMPRWGTESAMTTCYPGGLASPEQPPNGDGPPLALHFGVCCTAYADTIEEANVLLSVWNSIPLDVKPALVDGGAVAEMPWKAFFELQELMTPSAPGINWQINSFLNDPKMPLPELIKAIKPALTELPTPASIGCIYCCHSYPDEDDHLCSLPQQYYISTFTRWHDKSMAPKIYEPMADIYAKLYPIGVGMYIADYNPFDKRQAGVKVWPERGREKFLGIRARYDPHEMFTGFKPWAN